MNDWNWKPPDRGKESRRAPGGRAAEWWWWIATGCLCCFRIVALPGAAKACAVCRIPFTPKRAWHDRCGKCSASWRRIVNVPAASPESGCHMTNPSEARLEVSAIEQEPAGVAAAPTKSGRTRFVRLFPERLDFLLARLSARELAAYLRILNEYAVRDGDMPAADRAMREITKLSNGAWAALRDRLITLGICRIENGRWIDEDQDANLRRQREFSEAQRQRALGRWAR